MLEVLKTDQYCKTTLNFVQVIADNGRLPLLPKIFGSFEEIMRAHRAEASVKVYSSKALSDSEKSKLEKLISPNLPKGHTLQVNYLIDPLLLGGFIIQLEDKTIDLSVRNKLRSIEAELSSV